MKNDFEIDATLNRKEKVILVNIIAISSNQN